MMTQRHGKFAVQALRVRLRDQVIGALNLFRATPGPFDPADVRTAQALSLDAISSVAYGPEAVLVVLATAGAGTLAKIEPIAVAIVVLLAILLFSYRQVIQAYPDGRGCYAVSRSNLGARASHLRSGVPRRRLHPDGCGFDGGRGGGPGVGGLVIALAGALVIEAAVKYLPSKADGLDTALKTLRGQSFGEFAPIAAGLGLMIFGVYGLCEARWRKA